MRRFIPLLAALIALISMTDCALAEVYAVNFSSGCTVIDDKYEVIISSGIYDRIYVMRNDYGDVSGYAAGIYSSGVIHYALLDADGNQMTDFIYNGVWAAGEGYVVCENGIYRYITENGIYNNYEFSALKYIGSGRLLAVTGNRYDDISDVLTILWPDGVSFGTGIKTMNDFSEYSEMLMPLYDDETGLYGYIDTEASWAIKPSFVYAGGFANGMAVIATDDGYGIIDAYGKLLFASVNDLILRNEHLFAVIRYDTLKLYDTKLSQTHEMPLYGADVMLTGNCAVVSRDDYTTVCDVYGEAMFSVDGDATVGCYDDGIFIIRDGRWTELSAVLCDENGTFISERYNTIYGLGKERLAYGILNEDGIMLYGMLDTQGFPVTDAEYLSMTFIAEGIYCADIETGAVILNADGEKVAVFESEPVFDQN